MISRPPMDKIEIEGLRVVSNIGVTEAERSRPQSLEVTLTLVPTAGLGGLGDEL